jgi:hypothetical protein
LNRVEVDARLKLMSIAAEHVADSQRLRERLRAVTLDTKLAVSGLVAIAIRVLDDNSARGFAARPPR